MTTKVLPSHRLFKQFQERIVLGDLSLSEVVRAGAQLMLQRGGGAGDVGIPGPRLLPECSDSHG